MLQATIAEQLVKVRARIEEATRAAQRPAHSVQLLAVSKTKSVDEITQAYQAGQRLFGENYVQEGLNKIQALRHLQDIEWHFIGELQANKTRQIAENFHWLQSLDRLRIARRLHNQRPAHLPPLQVLIQVNINQEESKAGILPHELNEFMTALADLPRLQLRGFMFIPQANLTEQEQANTFQQCQAMFIQLQEQLPKAQQQAQVNIDTLSLGMSRDLATAIAYGSTQVRVGTDIFGHRQ